MENEPISFIVCLVLLFLSLLMLVCSSFKVIILNNEIERIWFNRQYAVSKLLSFYKNIYTIKQETVISLEKTIESYDRSIDINKSRIVLTIRFLIMSVILINTSAVSLYVLLFEIPK